MIVVFQQIKYLAEDVRLNSKDTDEIKEFKLRQIEDMCSKSIRILNDIRHENN